MITALVIFFGVITLFTFNVMRSNTAKGISGENPRWFVLFLISLAIVSLVIGGVI